MKRIYIKALLMSLLLGLNTACDSDYLDINTDPNNPTVADVNLALPAGQAQVAFIVGGQLNILGGVLAQYWTIPKGGNQYRSWDQYNITSSTLDGQGGQFVGMYAGALQDFQYVINQGSQQNEWRMVGISKIMKAYGFGILTDLYGDIPFSEALNADLTITPRYDAQKDVYAGLQTLLDEAKADIAKKQGRFPGTADMLYQAANEAGMDRWVRLANTLKLKFYLRLSQVDPATARAGIQALYASSGTAFMQAGESLEFANGTVTNSENPFWQANFRLSNNLTASTTIGNLMAPNNDPRMPVYFLDADLRTPEIEYVFTPNGTTSTNTAQYTSYPGKYFIGQRFLNGTINGTSAGSGVTAADDNAAKARPVVLVAYEESLLLRAEAVARGWAGTTTDDPAKLYNEAITASMARFGVQAGDYLTKPGVDYARQTDKIRAIITQKYLALYGLNGVEAWSEQRRTGFPAPTIPVVNLTGNQFMKRLPYVDSELQRNPNITATGIAPGDVLTPVWWDAD
ncbi:SusD-like starch-binding protein associating with outer membrane [Larkinella arboricola]|uniref:SusD-like starch-binding protein associating with outer membrane n=1 Tax=Larkinella arboricola TaxID=643671 RepID=A0A327WPD1_LARAB|nr:SusD/RagB family nutrient-binding outer membrane lipoprotein [Larkinella arboricola]RAJ92176.1 SusD-like starch-binding protein associating with outer membrane [Larkinella arboricola]